MGIDITQWRIEIGKYWKYVGRRRHSRGKPQGGKTASATRCNPLLALMLSFSLITAPSLLLVAGDVERNPGPPKTTEERPESKVIRTNSARIAEQISRGRQVDWFAANLTGKAFIANAQQFTVLGSTPFSQVSQMLGAVESMLKTTDTPAETLKKFIGILQDSPVLEDFAKQLIAEYESYGGTAFQSSSSASGSSSGAGSSSSTAAGIPIGPTAISDHDDFSKMNLSIIKGKFGKLVLFVQKKIQKDRELNKEDFWLFLGCVLPSEAMNCLPQSSDLKKLFEAITFNKLWSFLEFHLLEQIVEQFWESDQELIDRVEQYKKDLSGYKTATKVKDFIAAALQLDAETSTSTSDFDSLQSTCDPKYFKKLSIKLGKPFGDSTLDYLSKLWKSLQNLLRLPPLTLLLHEICEGCICVTWLIPTHLAPQATERSRQCIKFLKGYPILTIIISNEIVYEVKPIVLGLEGKTSHVLAKEMAQELQEIGQRESGEYTLDTAKLKSVQSSVADCSTSQHSKRQEASPVSVEESHPPPKRQKLSTPADCAGLGNNSELVDQSALSTMQNTLEVPQKTSDSHGITVTTEASPVSVEESHPPPKRQNLNVPKSKQPAQQHTQEGAAIVQFQEKVKCYYLKNPEVHCQYGYFPPTRLAKYINLALLDRGQLSYNDDFSSYMIQRSADDVFAKKTGIRYDELFQAPKNGSRILIEGRPGCGKTTLLRKISRDWAEKKVLTNISLLLLVPLRHFHSKENIECKDILKVYNAGPEVESEIAIAVGHGICILLDGIDDYPHSSSQEGFILALMQRRLLPESIVIVSSRPASSHFLRGLATDRAEVLGFLRPQIYQYIQECYPSEQQKAKALSTYLESHPNIRHMCYLPLHLAMIVHLIGYLHDKHQSMPRTETEVYLRFTTYSLLRDMQRDREHNIPLKLISPENLPHERLHAFEKICQLAYIGILESEQIFSGEDISKLFGVQGVEFKPLGILTMDRQFIESGLEESFSFVHLTFQEFLAAYHLTKCSDTEQIECIEHYGRNKNMNVVWKFYCGLTQLKTGVSSQIFKLMTEVADFAMLDLLHCVHESLNSSYCRELLVFTNGIVKIADETLTPSDSVAIAYCMQNSGDIVCEVKLHSCRWDEEEISVLSSHMTTNITTVKTLCFEHTPVRKRAISLFLELLRKFPFVETLILNKCISRLQNTEEVLSSITGYKSLRYMSIDISVAKDRSIQALISSFQSLEVLRLNGSKLAVEVSKEHQTAKLVDISRKKEVILVSADRASPIKITIRAKKLLQVDVVAIVELLKFCPSVESIILDGNQLGDDGMKVLSTGLRYCANLQTLDLVSNNIGVEGARHLSSALNACTSLQTLNLWDNNITDEAVDSLVEIIKTLKDLEHLYLIHNKFTDSGKATLRKAAEDRKGHSDFISLL